MVPGIAGVARSGLRVRAAASKEELFTRARAALGPSRSAACHYRNGYDFAYGSRDL